MNFHRPLLLVASIVLIGVTPLSQTAASAIPSAQDDKTDTVRVPTYHYDYLRTGWNFNEKALTPPAVASNRFKMIASVPLDDLVHAQPLVMTNQPIRGKGVHTVVYVATENNTLYAIDANSGAVLRKHNFGPSVPYFDLPEECTNNGPNVGIESTPAIIEYFGKMYLVTYTLSNSKPGYQLHKVDMASLEDTMKPMTITASAKLSDGSIYRFDPAVTRQRPALLVSSGNVYVGFGSFCDSAYDRSRGWMLGFSAFDLSPLAANELTNARARAPNNFFLTSVWMSGAGPAASLHGDVYFVTGNSDFSGTTFDPHNNIEESVAELSADLSGVEGLFTPKGPTFGWRALDKVDNDFGSGGIMLLPPQKGAPSNLAVALGKSGKMYLLNADDLKNGARGNASAYDVADAGACWCAESYFEGADGTGRVVTSGNNMIRVWKVITGNSPKFQKEMETGAIQNGQDPGVLTVASSNNLKGTVIWAAGRPVDFKVGKFKLYAFDAESGKTLFSGDAGVWPFPQNDATIMPVVANGHALVASYKTLSIFGLSDGPAAALPNVSAPEVRAELEPGHHEIYGTVRGIDRHTLTVEKRDGSILTVDVSQARARHAEAPPSVGNAVIARGVYARRDLLMADSILHSKNNPAMWYSDR